MDDAVLLAAQVTSGLLAGLYFAYAVSVMPGLKSQDDQTFVTVMNRINVVIVNPIFVPVFLGAPALAVAVLGWERSPEAITAAVLGVLCLLISFGGNIPLNNALAKDDNRQAFEQKWVGLNIVRMFAGIGSFVTLLLV